VYGVIEIKLRVALCDMSLQKHSCLVFVHTDDCFVALLCIAAEIVSTVVTSGVDNDLCVFTEENHCDSPIDESQSQLITNIASRYVTVLCLAL